MRVKLVVGNLWYNPNVEDPRRTIDAGLSNFQLLTSGESELRPSRLVRRVNDLLVREDMEAEAYGFEFHFDDLHQD